MIPMLRNRCNGACFDIIRNRSYTSYRSYYFLLPPIMGECFVGIRHAMSVVFLLHRVAAIVSGIENLARQTISHCFLATSARVADYPPYGQAVTARFLIDFDRHLIRRAADSTRLDLYSRFYVINGLLESLERILLGLIVDLSHRAVEDALGHRLSAFPHQRIDEPGHHRRVV